MLQIKLVLAIIVMIGAGGGYLYINKLQKDNATLKTNQIKLESAVEDNNQVIEQQIEDINKIRNTLEIVEAEKKTRHHGLCIHTTIPRPSAPDLSKSMCRPTYGSRYARPSTRRRDAHAQQVNSAGMTMSMSAGRTAVSYCVYSRKINCTTTRLNVRRR